MKWMLPALLTTLFLSTCQSQDKHPTAEPQPETVAVLEEKKADVDVRKAHDLAWKPVHAGAELANFDAIRTPKGGAALLKYSDETAVALAENSMVIVLDRQMRQGVEQTVIALNDGSIEGQLSDTTEKKTELIVKTRSGWVKVASKSTSGKARFTTSIGRDGRLEVKSEAGSVAVMAKGRERTVGQNESLVLTPPPGGAKSASNLITSPEEFASMPEIAEQAWAASRVSPLGALRKGGAAEVDLFWLSEPAESQVVHAATVRVAGEVAGRLQAYLGDRRIEAGENGKFQLEVPVNPGDNSLKFKIVGPGPNDVRYEIRKVTRR
jgi:FecR protein